MACVLCPPAAAALSQADELPAVTNPPGPAATGLDMSTAAIPGRDSGSQHDKTIELLLQLQAPDHPRLDTQADSKSRNLDRARARSDPPVTVGAKPSLNTEIHPLVSIKDAILGPGAVEETGSAERLVSQRDDPDRSAAAPAQAPFRPLGAAQASGPGLLAHPVIRFIRENRGFVIGSSLGLLVAVWLTANYRSRSGRRR